MICRQELPTDTRCKSQSAAIGEGDAVMSAFESSRCCPKVSIKVVALRNSDVRQIGDGIGSLSLTRASDKIVENLAQIDRMSETLTAGSRQRILDDLRAGFAAQIRNHR